MFFQYHCHFISSYNNKVISKITKKECLYRIVYLYHHCLFMLAFFFSVNGHYMRNSCRSGYMLLCEFMKLYFANLIVFYSKYAKVSLSLWFWHFKNSGIYLVCPEMFERSENVAIMEDFLLLLAWGHQNMIITVMLAPFLISLPVPPKTGNNILNIWGWGGSGVLIVKLWKD